MLRLRTDPQPHIAALRTSRLCINKKSSGKIVEREVTEQFSVPFQVTRVEQRIVQFGALKFLSNGCIRRVPFGPNALEQWNAPDR